jgi:uncharacterized RDD family membrane protein YckC
VSRGARAGLDSARRIAGVTGLDAELERAIAEAVTAVIESPAFERALANALESPAVERSAMRVLDSTLVDQIVDRLLESDEIQKLIERIAEAPEVRSAITYQGVGLIEDLGEQVTRLTGQIDTRFERAARRFRGKPAREPTRNAGLLTRAVALAVDVAAINGVWLLISAAIGLLLSAIGLGTPVRLALGAATFGFAGTAYLLIFWSLTGQTLGMRFLGLRVIGAGAPHGLGLRRSAKRFVCFLLAALPAFLGFLSVLTDDRRRGFHDKRADTEVVIEREATPFAVPPRVPAASGPSA